MVLKKCEHCSNDFETKLPTIAKYCSKRCCREAGRVSVKCSICGEDHMALKQNLKLVEVFVCHKCNINLHRNTEIKNCDTCGKLLSRGQKKYCSTVCRTLPKANKCVNCGAIFSTERVSSKKYCNDLCRKEYQEKNNKIDVHCDYCGIKFKTYKSKIKKYCSKSCSYKGINRESKPKERIEKICVSCGSPFKVRPSSSKQKYCSTTCRSNRVDIKCKTCDKVISVPYSEKSRIYCSIACCDKDKIERIDKKCITCGENFTVVKSRSNRLHCSDICKKNDLQVTVTCEQCGNEFKTTKFSSTKRKFCSYECSTNSQENKVIVGCLWCKKDVEVIYSARANNVFCSKECDKTFRKYNIAKFRSKITAQLKKKWKEDPIFREKMHYYSLASTQSKKETCIEKYIREWLEKNNIKHTPQCIIENKFSVDFYLPDHNIIIEAQGDYWHANPIYYDSNDLHFIQSKNVKRDKSRVAYLTKCGYSLYLFWETDIKKDLEKLMKSMKELELT